MAELFDERVGDSPEEGNDKERKDILQFELQYIHMIIISRDHFLDLFVGEFIS